MEEHAGGLHGRTRRGTPGLHGRTLQKLGTGQVGQEKSPLLPGSGLACAFGSVDAPTHALQVHGGNSSPHALLPDGNSSFSVAPLRTVPAVRCYRMATALTHALQVPGGNSSHHALLPDGSSSHPCVVGARWQQHPPCAVARWQQLPPCTAARWQRLPPCAAARWHQLPPCAVGARWQQLPPHAAARQSCA